MDQAVLSQGSKTRHRRSVPRNVVGTIATGKNTCSCVFLFLVLGVFTHSSSEGDHQYLITCALEMWVDRFDVFRACELPHSTFGLRRIFRVIDSVVLPPRYVNPAMVPSF